MAGVNNYSSNNNNRYRCNRVISNPLQQRLVIVSYNLHGFNQGSHGIKEMISTLNPDAIMVQEHWLYLSNISKLNDISDDYFYFGSSAMDACLSAGPFYGRPFGGTAVIINKRLASVAMHVVSKG